MGTLRSGLGRLRLVMLLVSTGMLLSVFPDRVGVCAAPILAAEARPPARPANPRDAVPFTAAEVVRFFTNVLDVPPREGDNGATIFESRSGAPEEEHFRVLIAQEEGEVVVSFAVAGDYGLNFIREFFECELFRRDESEQLYRLLNEAEMATTIKLERFSVSARAWSSTEMSHLVLRFHRSNDRMSL